MKRNENLKTLSWEHHDGLVASFRLQQGIKNKTNTKEMVDYILHTWNKILEHHFWQEEQVISKKKINSKNAEEAISKMLVEHDQIKKLVDKIKINPSNEKLINEFAELLNKHIRFEERELFPLFEQETSKDELTQVGKFLREHHTQSCEIWPNQFWKMGNKSN